MVSIERVKEAKKLIKSHWLPSMNGLGVGAIESDYCVNIYFKLEDPEGEAILEKLLETNGFNDVKIVIEVIGQIKAQ